MLEMVLSVAMMGILSIAVYNLDRYYNKNVAHVYMQEEFNQVVETELSLAYSNGLDYQEKIIETNKGDILITASPVLSPSQFTEAIELKFEMDYLKTDFIVERSKYNGK